jgi:hypothetical protein
MHLGEGSPALKRALLLVAKWMTSADCSHSGRLVFDCLELKERTEGALVRNMSLMPYHSSRLTMFHAYFRQFYQSRMRHMWLP